MDKTPSQNGASATEDSYVAEYPGVCGGYPVIRDTRIAVRHVVWYYQRLGDIDKLVEIWPHISGERIRGALDYYARHPTRVDEDIERNERTYAEAHGLPWPA